MSGTSKYKWDSPHQWLGYYISKIVRDAVVLKETSPANALCVLESVIHALGERLDGDTIQDVFEDRMEYDGYFDPLHVTDAMVFVPAGTFLMGNEGQSVYVGDFWIDKFPVTNAEYARFVDATGCNPPEHWESRTPPQEIADHPVVYVNWCDAVTYAEWAGKRLPTEEEWEKAARGMDGRVYPWGDDFDKDKCNSEESGIHGTTPVGRYSPEGDSPYGCVDMAGNVWEWTASDCDKNNKVLRGGSWNDDAYIVRSAHRSRFFPSFGTSHWGFRCCMSSTSSS